MDNLFLLARLVPRPRVDEERLFLVGQSIIEAALPKESLGSGNGHDLQNLMLPSTLDTGFYEQPADPLPLSVRRDGEALEFGQFFRVDIDGGKADDLPVSLGDETVPRQVAEFVERAAEQDALLDVRFHQRFDGFAV